MPRIALRAVPALSAGQRRADHDIGENSGLGSRTDQGGSSDMTGRARGAAGIVAQSMIYCYAERRFVRRTVTPTTDAGRDFGVHLACATLLPTLVRLARRPAQLLRNQPSVQRRSPTTSASRRGRRYVRSRRPGRRLRTRRAISRTPADAQERTMSIATAMRRGDRGRPAGASTPPRATFYPVAPPRCRGRLRHHRMACAVEPVFGIIKASASPGSRCAASRRSTSGPWWLSRTQALAAVTM